MAFLMGKYVHLFRHGEPDASLHGCLRGGGNDCGLSTVGVEQTRHNVGHLVSRYTRSQRRRLIVWTSGMKRTNAFGEMAAGYGFEHRQEPLFWDIAAGEWEGISWSQIAERWPEQFARCSEDAMRLEIPGGEPVSGFIARVRRGWKRVLAAEGTVAVVGHTGMNEVILADADGREVQYFRNQINGCMNRLRVEDDGSVRVLERNRVLYPQHVAV